MMGVSCLYNLNDGYSGRCRLTAELEFAVRVCDQKDFLGDLGYIWLEGQARSLSTSVEFGRPI